MSGEMVVSDTRSIAAIGSGESVLGQTNLHIPIGGRIRSGIMVLTKAMQENERAMKIYNAGVAKGIPFKEIARVITQKLDLKRSPMTPRNVPYFTVRSQDFKNPHAAAEIMKLYASDGDEGKQLYRFPVIFALDNWQANMPHDFRCYSAAELKYWSQYDQQGRRFCLTHGETGFVGEGNNRKAKRTAGGRPIVVRQNESDGMCVPDDCPEYQNRSCSITGRFIFYVPGISGSSAIELPTRSFYSLQNARQQMEMVAYLTGGRISGTHNGKPLFWISKKKESVSMLDPTTGKPKRVEQWLISLEANIDMFKFFDSVEPKKLQDNASDAAAAIEYQDTFEDAEFDDVDPDPVEVVSDDQDSEPVLNHFERLEAQISQALTTDQINDALDLLRDDIEDLTQEDVAALRKRAMERVKEISKGVGA